MKLATHETLTSYEVIDRNDEEVKTYTFTSLRGAIRWIKEMLEVFEANASLINCYERTYDEYGNLITSSRCF